MYIVQVHTVVHETETCSILFGKLDNKINQLLLKFIKVGKNIITADSNAPNPLSNKM